LDKGTLRLAGPDFPLESQEVSAYFRKEQTPPKTEGFAVLEHENTLNPPEATVEVRGQRFLFAVEASKRGADYEKYERMRLEIWDDPGDHMAGQRNMVSENFFTHGGSLYIGIYREDEAGGFPRRAEQLVGFAYGYVGIKDKTIAFRNPSNLVFYSQYAAVKPGFRNLGLGVRLKEFQRDQVHNLMGIKAIICTYDPLVGVNAYRNIHVFGMEVVSYQDAYYRGFTGRLNRPDVPADRLLVHWDLERQKGREPIDLSALLRNGHNLSAVELERIEGRSGPIEMPVIKGVREETKLDPVLIEIPFDYYAMLHETDVADQGVRRIPITWRLLIRHAFHTQMATGYRVKDFLYSAHGKYKRDFYVLQKT
jgi:predicted GNAT superfamily acetyltransferase